MQFSVRCGLELLDVHRKQSPPTHQELLGSKMLKVNPGSLYPAANGVEQPVRGPVQQLVVEILAPEFNIHSPRVSPCLGLRYLPRYPRFRAAPWDPSEQLLLHACGMAMQLFEPSVPYSCSSCY